jgi:hypothetical protein
MARRPKIKTCADAACPAEFTGRGRYCEWHRAGRDPATTSQIKFRRERKTEQQRRRRRGVWDAQYVKSPLAPEPTYQGEVTTAPDLASSQVRGLHVTDIHGHVESGPLPIDVTGTPGMTVDRAIRIFMIEWDAYRELDGGGYE